MTDEMRSIIDDEDDLELITSWLNGHLDPERVEAVRKRLEEDPAFRDLAAPLLITWSIPRYRDRHPRPEGEWEQEWEKFKQRPGYKIALAQHQAQAEREARERAEKTEKPNWRTVGKRTWRWWTGWRGWWTSQGLRVFLLIGLGGVLIYGALTGDAMGSPDWDDRSYELQPTGLGWMPIGDGISVELRDGAQLRVRSRLVDGARYMMLDGTARFRVGSVTDFERFPRPWRTMRVFTRAGVVTAGENTEFTVRTRGDTAILVVHGEAEPFETSSVTATTALSRTSPSSTGVHRGSGARMIRGLEPEILTLQVDTISVIMGGPAK